MSDTNPTGITKDLTKDFDHIVKEINLPMYYKSEWCDWIKNKLSEMNKDIPREVTDRFVDFVYLTDHV